MHEGSGWVRYIPTCAGAVAALAGLIALLGWVLDDPLLRSEPFSGLSVKPNAAVCLTLAGLGMVLLSQRHFRTVGRVLGAAAGALAAATFSEHLVGWNLGIDQLLFTEEPGSPATTSPGRMGPPASLALTLIGLALGLAGARRRPRILTPDRLGVVVVALAALPVLGYLYGASALFGIARFTGIAFFTALALQSLGLGLIFLERHRGIAAAVLARSPRGIVLRMLLPAALLLPPAVGGAMLAGQRAGWFDEPLAIAVGTLVYMAGLAALAAWTAGAVAHREAALHQSAAQLRASEDRFSALATTVPHILWTADPAGGNEFLNSRFSELTGLPVEEGLGARWIQAVHPADVPELAQRWQHAVANGEPYSAEFRLRMADGSYRWHAVRASPSRDAAGRITRWFGVSTDVEDLKRTEQALRDSEERFQLAAEAMSGVVYEWDCRTGRVERSTGLLALLGYRPDEASPSADWWRARVHPDDLPKIERQYAEVLAARAPSVSREYRVRHRDGHWTWVWDQARINYDATGNPVRLIGATISIDQLKAVEAARHESEVRFRTAQQLSLDAFTILRAVRDGAGRIIDFTWEYANPVAARLLKSEPDALLGRRLLALLPGNRTASDLFTRYVRVVETGAPHELELPYFADGIGGWFRNMAVKLGDGVAVYFSDISERKRLERQRDELLESERLARAEAERASYMKDQFLATLSHELRTPLNAILGWAQMLRRGRLSAAETREALEIVESSARLQKQLIEDLLDVSRIISGKLKLERAAVDFATVVREALAAIRPEADAKGVLVREHLPPRAPVLGDAGRLRQLVGNLLSNAVKFTPAGRRISVRLAPHTADVVLLVRDTGIGIRGEFLPHLFERFRQADASSTRDFRGLGLGLSIVKQIAQLHGGTVHARSRGADRGALFVVALPQLDERTLPPDPGAGSPTDGAHRTLAGLTVLVVEDEPAALALVERVLRDAGARVIGASSAAQALAALASQTVSVVVSDISMPGEDGYSLIRKLRAWDDRARATIPAIAVTAFVRPEDRQRALAAGFQSHVCKPFEPHELVALVAGVAQLELSARSATLRPGSGPS